MTGIPKAEREHDILARLLAALETKGSALSAEESAARDQAAAWLVRLKAPVRIAVAGPAGAGKSSLINLFVSDDILPTAPGGAPAAPAVILRHAATPETTASWRDRPDRRFAGLRLARALADNPDTVALGLESDLLEDMTFVDISGLDDPATRGDAFSALTRHADMVVWCLPATGGWSANEQAVWDTLPTALQRRSLLAVTHTDSLARGTRDATASRLAEGAPSQIVASLPVATPEAWDALFGDVTDAERQWTASGAEALIVAIADLAGTIRQSEIDKAAADIRKTFTPLLDSLAPARPAAAPVTPLRGPAPRPEANPALANWKHRLAALHSAATDGTLADESALVVASYDTVAEFIDDPAGLPLLSAARPWLMTEFEAARDLLVLMQYETGTQTGRTAARVLVQLSDLLSWVADEVDRTACDERPRQRA